MFLRKPLALLFHKRFSLNNNQEKPNWLTEDFLKTVFDKGKPGNVRVSQAVPQGEGVCGDLYRVILDKKSVIVKTIPTGNIVKLVNYMKMFENEKMMYSVMDDVEMLIGERLAPKQFPYPEVLVLEDLKPLGYKVYDSKEQLKLEQCNLALNVLGKFHAASIPLIPFHTDLEEELYFDYSSPFSKTPVIEALSEVTKSWPEASEYSDRLKNYSKVAFQRTFEEVRGPKELAVINHGDYHTNNLMFNDKGSMLMLDFQFPRVNSPAMDIVYFAMTSVTYDVRKRHRKEIFKTYVQSFNKIADKLKLPHKITLEFLEKEINQFKNFALFTAAICTALVLSDCSEDVRRNYLDKRTIIAIQNTKAFRSVMPDILKEFSENRVF